MSFCNSGAIYAHKFHYFSQYEQVREIVRERMNMNILYVLEY